MNEPDLIISTTHQPFSESRLIMLIIGWATEMTPFRRQGKSFDVGAFCLLCCLVWLRVCQRQEIGTSFCTHFGAAAGAIGVKYRQNL